jgi:hypothetical protein
MSLHISALEGSLTDAKARLASGIMSTKDQIMPQIQINGVQHDVAVDPHALPPSQMRLWC